MRINEFAWNTVTAISLKDYQQLRLILDEEMTYPLITKDEQGYILKIPLPSQVNDEFYQLHGLYFDKDEHSLLSLWRIFKASLYHAALHAAYSNYALYAPWAKGKEIKTATFAVSLVEDYRITVKAAKQWPGVIQDISFANYIASLRLGDDIDDPALSLAARILLALWGVIDRGRMDAEVERIAAKVSSLVREHVRLEQMRADRLLFEALQSIYDSIMRAGPLNQVPFLPHTESHGNCTLFDSRITEKPRSQAMLRSAFDALGTSFEASDDNTSLYESREFFETIASSREKADRIKLRLREIMESTRLQNIEFPRSDYGMFLRVRAKLSGPIRNIRDQLRLVRNVPDETTGHESGQLDPQLAMQVIASGVKRNDVFSREEVTYKHESWAILIDASKSISPFAQTAREIAVALAEVAKDLFPSYSNWGLYSFNSSFQVLKDFDEQYTVDSKARIGGIVQRNATLLPDALTVSSKLLASAPAELKVMVVVSDGNPTGYPGIEESLVSIIKSMSRSGILLMGVGIDSRAIQDYFTVNCVIGSPYQMMKSFVKSYLQLSSMF